MHCKLEQKSLQNKSEIFDLFEKRMYNYIRQNTFAKYIVNLRFFTNVFCLIQDVLDFRYVIRKFTLYFMNVFCLI